MKTRLFLLLFALLTLAGTSYAHDLEPLHVDGRYLKNPQGDIVTLHGLMMAVNGVWCEEGAYWTGDDYEGGVKYETQWVDSLLALDWKIDYIRILVSNEWITDKATGEYSLGTLKEYGYFEKLYIPIIEHLNSKGIYAVLYYDGIRPEDDLWRIGDESQQLAIEFWDYISSHPYVKNNPGIMMELYNEPITIEGSDGRQNNFKDVKNYFQPMVDVIRRNGCNNVVWVPGMGAQHLLAGYATNPIEGENIGYAIHAYWILNTWDNEITPVSNMAPCIITEMGWENKNEDEDETSTFGIALKHDIDRMGNVSWNPLVDGQGVYLQINQPSPDGSLTIYNDPEACMVPTWNWYKEYAETKNMPASQLRAVSVEMEDAPTSAFPGESRAMKLMAKFADGRSWNVAGDAVWTSSDESVLSIDHSNIHVKKAGQTTIHGTYTDSTGQTFEVQFDAVSSMFPLTAAGANYFDRLFPNQFDEATRTFSGIGFGGWWWADGIDLSAYHYLVIHLDEAYFYPMTLGVIDSKGDELSIEIREQSEGIIDLQQSEKSINLSDIKYVQVGTLFPPTAPIKEIFLSNDGVTPAEPPVMRPWGYADDKSMTYGDEVPELTYSMVGTTPSQAPVLSTTATKASPVGAYEITIADSDDGVDYQPGTLQVLPAQLTVTAGDVVIGAGMDIPALTLTYEGFRNGDTEATALGEKPTVTTTATKDSPCGNYAISVIGGSAANYDMVYYSGTLTISWTNIDDFFKNSGLKNNQGKTFNSITIADGKQFIIAGTEAVIDNTTENLATVLSGKTIWGYNYDHPIALTDNDTYSRGANLPVSSATYTKTIAEGRKNIYHSWLVPFDHTITATDAEKFTFYKLYMIANAIAPDATMTDDMWLYVRPMAEGDVLHANMPYIYKAKEGVSGTFEFTTPNAILKAKADGARITMMTAENTYTLYGTYGPTTATAQDPFYYMNINGNLSLGNDGTVTVGAFRWIMRVENKFGSSSSAAYARRIIIYDGESETTGVNEVREADGVSGDSWYSLDGRKLQGKPSRAGVYIYKGKKTVIK